MGGRRAAVLVGAERDERFVGGPRQAVDLRQRVRVEDHGSHEGVPGLRHVAQGPECLLVPAQDLKKGLVSIVQPIGSLRVPKPSSLAPKAAVYAECYLADELELFAGGEVPFVEPGLALPVPVVPARQELRLGDAGIHLRSRRVSVRERRRPRPRPRSRHERDSPCTRAFCEAAHPSRGNSGRCCWGGD